MGLTSSISWNIRNFFRVFFLKFFQLGNSPLKFFKLGQRKFHFLKYKKNFFGENVRIFLILRLESSIFRNKWKIVLRNYKNFSQSDFFLFLFFELGMKSAPVIFSIYTTRDRHSQFRLKISRLKKLLSKTMKAFLKRFSERFWIFLTNLIACN